MQVENTVVPSSTTPATIAQTVATAGDRHGATVALRYKDVDRDSWLDVSFADLDHRFKELALGLLDLGIQPGDRISLFSSTRPEWTYFHYAILCCGATLVPIYETSSADECRHILANSQARAVVVEGHVQLEKINAVRHELGELSHVISIEPIGGNGVIDSAELAERGRHRQAAELNRRIEAIKPDDLASIVYTSGTTGAPKGCALDHSGWHAAVAMVGTTTVPLQRGESGYLFLPLAHVFAQLIELIAAQYGGTLIYWEGDQTKILPNLAETHPNYFPSVPRLFEKFHATALARLEGANSAKKWLFTWALTAGRKARELETAGKDPGLVFRLRYALADKLVLSKVRDLFGGQIKLCITGSAPISPEILGFFWACGVPILETYGMTEAVAITINPPEAPRLGSVGKPLPGIEIKIGVDDEILVHGPCVFRGYYRMQEATDETMEDGWLHTGDLGRIDEDGYLHITGRKKDLIITAGGKNIAPAPIENDLKQRPLISQAVLYGDRRPFVSALITLDEEELAEFARQQNWSTTSTEPFTQKAEIRALVQRAVDEVNATLARPAQVKKFTILPRELSQDANELTPTLKVKRNIVYRNYAAEIESMYRQ